MKPTVDQLREAFGRALYMRGIYRIMLRQVETRSWKRPLSEFLHSDPEAQRLCGYFAVDDPNCHTTCPCALKFTVFGVEYTDCAYDEALDGIFDLGQEILELHASMRYKHPRVSEDYFKRALWDHPTISFRLREEFQKRIAFYSHVIDVLSRNYNFEVPEERE